MLPELDPSCRSRWSSPSVGSATRRCTWWTSCGRMASCITRPAFAATTAMGRSRSLSSMNALLLFLHSLPTHHGWYVCIQPQRLDRPLERRSQVQRPESSFLLARAPNNRCCSATACKIDKISGLCLFFTRMNRFPSN